MPDNDKSDGPVIRPFADFLQDHHTGKTAVEAGERLHELVQAIRDTGKKGSLTLTLDVEPMKGDADTLVVTATTTTKLPKPERKGAVFFADDTGNLRRNDPRQAHLPLKGLPGVDDDEQPLKTVGDA